MKLVFTLAALVLVSSAFAESLYEKENREEMLARTETLIQRIESAKGHLKEEKVTEACDDLRELLKIYPEHLKGIGTHMDNGRTKVVIARDEVLQQLIFIHRQTVVCGQGERAEYVDPKDLGKKLARIEKRLKKQKKLIKKESTDFSNTFSYRYEF